MKKWLAEEKRLLFHETDMSSWAHNSHFMRWVENATHELFYTVGTSPVNEGTGWPRAHFSIDFRSPLTFNQPYRVALTLIKLGTSSITFGFEIHSGERLVAEGKMTSVLVNKLGRPTPIPEKFKEGIKAAFEG